MSSPVPVVLELARIQGSRMARHPAHLAGVGIVLVGGAVYLRSTWSGSRGVDDDGWVLFAALALFGVLVMVAANLVALRDHRSGTVEQHEASPTSATRQVWGVLAGLLVPLGVCTGAAALALAHVASREPLPAVEVVVIASVVPLTLTLGSLGVALARWVPSPFVAPAIALGLYFWVPSDPQKPWQVLLPLNPGDSLPVAAWHVIYLLGLATLFTTLALAGTRPRPSTAATASGAAVGAGLVLVASMAMLR